MGVIVRQKVQGKGNPWCVFVTHAGKRTSRQGGDKKAAEKVASDIRPQLQLDQFEFEEKKRTVIPLFEDFAKGFMETYSAMNHKESTRDSYQSLIDQHLIPHFGKKSLDRDHQAGRQGLPDREDAGRACAELHPESWW